MPHHFSFSGCGFLGIYHLGVSACLKQHVPKLLEDCKIAGASAGSFVACCLLTGCSIDECTRYVLDLVDQAESQPILGPLHPRFKLTSGLRESMFRVLPPDAYKIATGRLFISLTRCKDLKNIIVSEYESNTELIDAMLCSGFVPLYSGIIPPKYKDDYYFDGGISDNQPVFEEPTITVSPFSGETDICPLDNSSNFVHVNICNSSVQFTQENLHRLSIALFPPKSLTMSEICEQGYNDTLRYLKKNGMINCIYHLNVPAEPCFQKKDIRKEDQEEKEKTEKKPEDDSDCRECKQNIRKTLFSSLPPHILQVFHSTMTSNQQNLLNYISQGKLFQALSMLITPFTAPADILWATLTSLINKIPNSQQKLEDILKEFHFIFLCFIHNFLDKMCTRNRKEIKIDECMDTAYSYFYNMEKLLQEQVSKNNMDNFPKDNNDSSRNPNAFSSNIEVEVKNLEKNQESPNEADSKEFLLTCSCSIGAEIGPTNNNANQPHLEILTDPVKNNFDKEQSKNDIQMNKSETMEATNEQNHQMNLSDSEQDSTMIDKHHLEILSNPVQNSLDKEQSKNDIQINKSETMEATNEQNHQMNLSDSEQDSTMIDKHHLEILSNPVQNSLDKEQNKNDIQINKSETMEATNEQNHQMNLSDSEQDSTMIDKPHLEILSNPVQNSLDKEQSKNDIQISKSETMEATNEQNQMNLSEFEQNIPVTDKPQLGRSQRNPLHESVPDFRSTSDRDTQNKSENMEAHKNQYLLKYKECDTSIDQFPPENLPSDSLLCSQSNMECNEENNPKDQIKIMEAHKEEKLCEECDLAINESLTETSVDEHLVDKHLVDEHLDDEHLVDEHLDDEHLDDEHLVVKHQVDEHLVVEHQIDEHLVVEHQIDEHLVVKHLVDEHLVVEHLVVEHQIDEHLVDEHLVVEHLVVEHQIDEHLVDEHLVVEHLVDEHLVDEHLVDREHLDGLKNETISSSCEESLITVDQKFLRDRLESSDEVKEICHSEYNTVHSNEENSQPELSKSDENNEKPSNSNISLNYRNVRTLSIQNYAEDTEEIPNVQTGHILSPITDSISAYSNHLIQRVSIAQVWSQNVIKKLTSPVTSSQK